MADIELVIKIDEEDYETLININDSRLPSTIARKHLYNALVNGTPLPNGHGRLIDVDNITSIVLEDSVSYLIWRKDSEIDCVINAPTIIDADKENDNEVYN